jgi:putative transposase
MKQLAFRLKTWGGARKGAGRKPSGVKARVSHLRRPRLSGRHPVHVTSKMLPGVGYLRQFSRARQIEAALAAARDRFGMKVAHYSIQGNHLHLIVEVYDRRALSRGMQGFSIRAARALNRLAARSGRVFADRYHAHVLTTRREAAHAVRYVLGNYRHHSREFLPPRWDDPFSSAREGAPVSPPRTWLLRVGWRLESG